MNSNNSNSVVDTLGTHVERLIADHMRLAQRVKELGAECDHLKVERRDYMEQINKLQHDLAQSNLAVTLAGGDGDTRRAKSYVNRLMREVDTCIALLSTAVSENETEEQMSNETR